MKRLVILLCISLSLMLVTIGAGCQETSEEAPKNVSFIQDGGYGYSATFQVALGDLDGDGDLDAVFANMNMRSEIWMNDGAGRFTRSSQIIGNEAHGIGIGDLDGDGDLDLVLTPASDSEASRIYFNDGIGRFTRAGHDLGDAPIVANAVALFDVEGDGDLDIGVYYFAGQRHCRLYMNDGTGQFTLTDLMLAGLAAWGDVDGDGDIDAVSLQHEQNGSGYKVFLNVGSAEFEEAQHVAAPGDFFPGSTALGDIDGDGDLDLVASNGNAPLIVLTNDGSGAFSRAQTAPLSMGASRLSLGDLTGDGADDVIVGCLDQPNRIAVSTLEGGLIDSGLRLGSSEMAGICAIGDLDGDGDLDILTAVYGRGGPNEVWLNLSED